MNIVRYLSKSIKLKLKHNDKLTNRPWRLGAQAENINKSKAY